MSFGDFALSSAKSCFRSRSAWFGWIFAFDPVRKNCSTPLCRKLFITRIVYIIAIHSGKPYVGHLLFVGHGGRGVQRTFAAPRLGDSLQAVEETSMGCR